MRKHRNKDGGELKKRSPRGMGSLYKRDSAGREHPADWNGTGAYWLAYTAPSSDGGTGQRIRAPLKDEKGEPITDRDEAEAARKVIIAPFMAKDTAEAQRQLLARLQTAEQRLDAAIDAAAPVLKIADAWRAYVAHPGRPDSGRLTMEQYEAQWARFNEWMREHHPEATHLRDVTRAVVRQYAADLAAKLSPSTFNQHINTLRRFWRVLREEARTESNDWLTIAHKTVERVERRHRVLTMDEASKVIEAASGDMKDLLAVIAMTGQRLQDVCKLNWSSVDLGAGVIALTPTKTRRRNGKAVFIPVLPQTRAILEARPRTGARVFPGMAELFDRDRGSTLTKRIRDVVEAAGLQPHEDGTGVVETTDKDGKPVKKHSGHRAIVRVSAHSLRHTFTTIARAAGIPDAVVRSIVGHSTASMTEHYTAFDKALVANLASRFEALPAGQGGPLPALAAGTAEGTHEPLPTWARQIIESMTGKTWKAARTELLKRGAM